MDEHTTERVLDDREKSVLVALIEGGSVHAAATSIGLSDRHTRRLISRIKTEVGLDNTYALVAWAIANSKVIQQASTTAGDT